MTDADDLVTKTELVRSDDFDLPLGGDLDISPKWILPSAEATESVRASAAARETPLQHAHPRSYDIVTCME